ncbi:hypothetical protein DdX_18398 [Ditylenchus destructor]|uniref:Uncharacterized protein n=1 Tax=Ditylenchus destructor TaxID=166010 RepID=A0AAD4MKB9_9BILA|nr:hypothetical protein DdX_18398 [Ditylenchus destructor]
MIFEDELDLLGFSEGENDNSQAQPRQFRERQYFELENFTERFRLTREQVQQLVDEIGDLIGPNGHMAEKFMALPRQIARERPDLCRRNHQGCDCAAQSKNG